jgi:hypothetical protein
MVERLSNTPPDSDSFGNIDIGPVMDAKTLAKQKAIIATMKITRTVADRLDNVNTLKNLLTIIYAIRYIKILVL